MQTRRLALIVFILAALAGAGFLGTSTYDFVQHLDRGLHELNCAWIPGLDSTAAADGGCRAVLLSPYSSVFRRVIWGGIPIALPGLGVFLFLAFMGADHLVQKPDPERPDGAPWLVAATLIPLATSAVMFWVSTNRVGSICTLCMGTYISSAVVFGSALVAHGARDNRWEDEGEDDAAGGSDEWRPRSALDRIPKPVLYGLEGVLFTLLPVVVYAARVPDYGELVRSCDGLADPDRLPPESATVPMHTPHGGRPVLEIFDPLCPTCRQVAWQLRSAGLEPELDIDALLFPLDSTCNWTLSAVVHPGACLASELVLCAEDEAPRVIEWIFQNQMELIEKQGDIRADLEQAFPEYASCLGSNQVRTRLNRGLRWAASQSLPIETPQLFFGDRKLCSQDLDLGLAYALDSLSETP